MAVSTDAVIVKVSPQFSIYHIHYLSNTIVPVLFAPCVKGFQRFCHSFGVSLYQNIILTIPRYRPSEIKTKEAESCSKVLFKP
jgi:hypothetical protein